MIEAGQIAIDVAPVCSRSRDGGHMRSASPGFPGGNADSGLDHHEPCLTDRPLSAGTPGDGRALDGAGIGGMRAAGAFSGVGGGVGTPREEERPTARPGRLRRWAQTPQSRLDKARARLLDAERRLARWQATGRKAMVDRVARGVGTYRRQVRALEELVRTNAVPLRVRIFRTCLAEARAELEAGERRHAEWLARGHLRGAARIATANAKRRQRVLDLEAALG